MQANNQHHNNSFDKQLDALRRKYQEGYPLSAIAHELVQLGVLDGSNLLDPESAAYNEAFLSVFNAAVEYCDLEQVIRKYFG